MNIQTTSVRIPASATAGKAQEQAPPQEGQEQEQPRDGFVKTSGEVLLTTAISSAPMVMSAAFGLPGIAAGTASHVGFNYAVGIDLSRGLKNSVPMMVGAAATSAVFGTTTGIVASVACGLGMALHASVFSQQR